MPDDFTSSDEPLEEGGGEGLLIAHWPGDWPGRRFVNLDCVGDPGWWLDVNVASEAELIDSDSDDYWAAAALADSYIQKGHEMGFPLPSFNRMSAEEEREAVIEDFLGFIKEWRRRTMVERERKSGQTEVRKPMGPLSTWEVLKELGFHADPSVISDILPGLIFDLGSSKLSASAVMNMRFQEVVMFTGVLAKPRTLAEVQFEMPRQIGSREMCSAWLAWHLDKAAGGEFHPRIPVTWLVIGRANFRLLPWFFDQEAYEARPHCGADKALARPLLKTLAKMAEQMPANEQVWFSFDGEVLKIRAGRELLAIAAQSKAWDNQFGLNASELTAPPKRISGPVVGFGSWEDHFTIANLRLKGVAIKPVGIP